MYLFDKPDIYIHFFYLHIKYIKIWRSRRLPLRPLTGHYHGSHLTYQLHEMGHASVRAITFSNRCKAHWGPQIYDGWLVYTHVTDICTMDRHVNMDITQVFRPICWITGFNAFWYISYKGPIYYGHVIDGSNKLKHLSHDHVACPGAICFIYGVTQVFKKHPCTRHCLQWAC